MRKRVKLPQEETVDVFCAKCGGGVDVYAEGNGYAIFCCNPECQLVARTDVLEHVG